METGMRLCTFDDHDLLDCIPMRIDSVAQDCPALARAAFEMMQQLIAGNPQPRPPRSSTPGCAGAAAVRHTASLSCEKPRRIRRGFLCCVWYEGVNR